MRRRQLRFEVLETRRTLSGLVGLEMAWEVGSGEPLGPQQELSSSALTPVASASTAATPSDWDQYLLELINRGRLDPPAEAARYGIDLNQGISPGSILPTPKQPLAFSPPLIAAARGHSQWMLDTDTFSHTGQGGSSPSQRMAAAGYGLVLPWSTAENIAYRGSSGPIDKTATTARIHADLYGSPGHRQNQLNGSFREVGLGVVQGLFTSSGMTWNALMVTENFARSGSSLFLTGVVYDDARVLSDGFYTPGEGLGGITIRAVSHAGGQAYATETWSSGGYSLALPSGIYTVTAVGLPGGGSGSPQVVAVSTENVKLDFTPSDNLPPIVTSVTVQPETLVQPGIVSITAAAEDADGQVVRVDFYRGQVWLGSDDNGSDGWSWSGSTEDWPLGEHLLSVRARDDQGDWSEPFPVHAVLHGALPPVALGTVPVFATSQQSLAVSNSGSGPLTLQPPLPDSPFSIRPDNGGNGSSEDWIIASGATRTYVVSYEPTAVGLDRATLMLTGAAGNGPYLVHLTGSATSVWQNPGRPEDINGDGAVTPLDALSLINEINRKGARALAAADVHPSLFFDPSGDGVLSPADVLAVVNAINLRA